MSNKKTKLNNRQQRFVTEYLIDMNATQAAIRNVMYDVLKLIS